MGTLAGHLLPGSVFLILAVWWTWSLLHRYFICQKEARLRYASSYGKKNVASKYKNSASYPCSFSRCRRFHLEAIFKIVVTTVGIIGELITAFRGGEFVNIGNGQHISMYFFFLLNGISDLLQYHGYSLIPDLDYVTALLAVFIEAFLFFNHLHGRSSLDIQIHIFLVYVLVAILIFGLFEIWNRNSVLPALGRIYCFILQATWFYQVGFMLYPPNGNTWDQESHYSLMLATIIFTAHCGFVFLFMALAAVVISIRVKRMDSLAMQDIVHPYISMNATPGKVYDLQSDDGDAIVKINSESDEEL